MKRSGFLVAAFLALLLAGCAPRPTPVIVPPPPVAARYAIVLDSTGGPSVKAMKAAGVEGYIGYVVLGGSWKHISLGFANQCVRNGIPVGLSEEGAAGWMNGGRSAGVSAARGFLAQMKAWKWPLTTPVYLDCDQDVPANSAAVHACLDGAASVLPLGKNQLGLYAGYGPERYNLKPGAQPPTPSQVASANALLLSSAKHCKYHWQTLAWSGGKWSPNDNLQQHNGARLKGVGGDYDVNYRITLDWGQAFYRPAPAPKPAPKPVPKPAPKVVALRGSHRAVRATKGYWSWRVHAKTRYRVPRGARVLCAGIELNGREKSRYRGRTAWIPRKDLK